MKERRSRKVKDHEKNKKRAVWLLTRFPIWPATEGMIRILFY
jgi:hypothetical protein